MFNKEKIVIICDSEDRKERYIDILSAENAIPIFDFEVNDACTTIDDHEMDLIIFDIADKKNSEKLLSTLDNCLSTRRNIPIFAIVDLDHLKAPDAFQNTVKFLDQTSVLPLDVIKEANIILANKSIFNEL